MSDGTSCNLQSVQVPVELDFQGSWKILSTPLAAPLSFPRREPIVLLQFKGAEADLHFRRPGGKNSETPSTPGFCEVDLELANLIDDTQLMIPPPLLLSPGFLRYGLQVSFGCPRQTHRLSATELGITRPPCATRATRPPH